MILVPALILVLLFGALAAFHIAQRRHPANQPIRYPHPVYDPTKKTVPQTFNEHGFLTSPLPMPLHPRTGKAIRTHGHACDAFGHHLDTASKCQRCHRKVKRGP